MLAGRPRTATRVARFSSQLGRSRESKLHTNAKDQGNSSSNHSSKGVSASLSWNGAVWHPAVAGPYKFFATRGRRRC